MMTGRSRQGRGAGGLMLLSGAALVGCVEIDPSYAESTPTSTTAASSGTDAAGSTGTTLVPMTDTLDDSDDASTGAAATMNLAFVTSATFTGALGGLAGADATCQEAAEAAGLPGTYVAFLSDSTETALSRLGSASGWVRTDGLVWARDRDALLAGLVSYPLTVTEAGQELPGVDFIFTGTNFDGSVLPGENCNDWQDASPEATARGGYANAAGTSWIATFGFGCDLPTRLYCLGVDADAPVELPPPGPDARLIFSTSVGHPPAAGRDAADALCASEASAAGHTGTFLALMAAPDESLFERHAMGGDWVRADGAVVLPAAGGPAAWNEVVSPPTLDASGGLGASLLFVSGATSPTAVASLDTTCQDWTDAMDPAEMPRSFTYLTNWLDAGLTNPCDSAFSVICLEQ